MFLLIYFPKNECLSKSSYHESFSYKVMDFYHVLPSNTSPNYFPNNNASNYSTPLDLPYEFAGEWQVGLMNLTYSSCVNTFNNDRIIVKEDMSATDRMIKFAEASEKPFKVMLPPQNTNQATSYRDIVSEYINKNFKSLLQLTMSDDKNWTTWKILNDNFYFILSPNIRELFQLWSDVLTDTDMAFKNRHKLVRSKLFPTEKTSWIIIGAKAPSTSTFTKETVILKRANETLTSQELIQRFNTLVSKKVAKLTVQGDTKFILSKLQNDNVMILLNKFFREAMTFRRSAMFGKANQKHRSTDLKKIDKNKIWSVSLYVLDDIHHYNVAEENIVTIPPCSFQEESQAISYLNNKLNDPRISFTCNQEKRITLKVGGKNLKVILDAALRDILAFDTDTFIGPGEYTASGLISLTRCIQYLYIYSNIASNVRVGNTESPLLAVIPFSMDKPCSILREKAFKTPMYIRVKQNRISQIDVGIYDGAGEMVPFVSDAVTTLYLHFQQI